MSKLRARETLGFRPETPAQEKLINDAREATGFTMARLLREAVMAGLPIVVSGVQSQQKAAFEQFQSSLRETVGGSRHSKASVNPSATKSNTLPIPKTARPADYHG